MGYMPLSIYIAAGGALGALGRYGLGHLVTMMAGHGFPYGTLCANILGSLIMGILISSFALFWDVPQQYKAFMTIGFLGAFTTFSTFSLDTVTLIERGALMSAFVYVLLSVLVSIGALFCGMWFVRTVYS